MMEHTTDRLFWTLTSMLVAALILTIGINAFPKATQNVIQPISGVIKQADRVESTSNDAANKAMNDLGSSNTSSSTNNTTQTVDQDAIDRANAVDASSVNLQVTDNGDGTGTINSYTGDAYAQKVVVPKYVKVNNKVVTITAIGDYTFGYKYIHNIVLPNSIKTIGNWAFQYNQLTDLVIPEGVTTIGRNAFVSNPDLQSLSLPNTLTNVGFMLVYTYPSGSKIQTLNIPNAQGYQSAINNNATAYTNTKLTNNPS